MAETKKHGCIVTGAVFIFMMVAIGMCVSSMNDKKEKPQSVLSTLVDGDKNIAGKSSEARKSLPWLKIVEDNCAAYKTAPNEILKSDIYRLHRAALKKITMTKIKGVLNQLSTTQGGDSLSLKILVGDSSFSTESIFNSIPRKSKIYRDASSLQVGQCVIFSARTLEPKGITERAMTCEANFFAKFTSIVACPIGGTQ